LKPNGLKYSILRFGGVIVKTSDMIRQLCGQMNISVSELARRLGQSPQNFGKKLKRETITLEELKAIADVMNVKFEQAFILPNGNVIKTGNE
jgi:transcriptional regulator with XRE-family HTH domain